MCRLVGIVASEFTEFALVLKEAPRSLASLSHEHPDGWGIAIHDAEQAATPWAVHKGTQRAGADDRFHELAARCRGHMLVAHIRQKTVGPTRLENTHPFSRDGWVFAHNGTIQGHAELRAGCSARRLDEITGDTDSEVLFAYLLSRLDEHGVSRVDHEDAREAATRVLESVTRDLRQRNLGAFNFLLTNGATCFAHRFGRTLFLLERGPNDPVREQRAVGPDAAIVTRWTARRRAVFVASERMTDEPWQEVPEGTMLRIDRAPTPSIGYWGLGHHRVAS